MQQMEPWIVRTSQGRVYLQIVSQFKPDVRTYHTDDLRSIKPFTYSDFYDTNTKGMTLADIKTFHRQLGKSIRNLQ